MGLKIAAMSEQGTREEQQDSFLYGTEESLSYAVVCDGMGGMEGGGTASREAAKALEKDIRVNAPIRDIPAFLESEAKKLDARVCQLTDESGKRIRGGTTVAAVLIQGNAMHWLTVGDSEIFVIRGNEAAAVNQKHNYQLQLDEMLAHGRITEKLYQAERGRGAQLISYLGMGNISLWDVNQRPLILKKGDYVCLSTDGLVNAIPREELLGIVKGRASEEQVVHDMRRRVRERQGSQDNATAVLIHYL